MIHDQHGNRASIRNQFQAELLLKRSEKWMFPNLARRRAVRHLRYSEKPGPPSSEFHVKAACQSRLVDREAAYERRQACGELRHRDRFAGQRSKTDSCRAVRCTT